MNDSVAFATIIFILGGTILMVFIMRLLGAWMLRINEVIKHQKSLAQQNEQVIGLLKQIRDGVKGNK